jgi:hypothetical protein
MGITLSRKRDAAAGSIACMAAIPREEMARLIDRCWAAACEEGRRISGVDFFVKTKKHAWVWVCDYQDEPHRFRLTNPWLRTTWRRDNRQVQRQL